MVVDNDFISMRFCLFPPLALGIELRALDTADNLPLSYILSFRQGFLKVKVKENTKGRSG